MNEVMRLAHKFLQSFCLGNQANQAILHQSLDLFLTPGVCINISAVCDILVCLLACMMILNFIISLFMVYCQHPVRMCALAK